MGRIFEKRKERMFARWSKNAKAFTKVGKEIAIAVKLGGADPDNNPRLRMAVQTARTLNMPKDRVEAAIKRASSKDMTSYSEISYEGYGQHGIAIFVEAATDNPTRTVANVRSIFTRWEGSLGTSGSLEYVFERRGVFSVARPQGSIEDLELELIDHGLEELSEGEEGILLQCKFGNFHELQKAIEAKGLEIKSAGLQRFPLSLVEVSENQAADIEKLVSALEEDDDVQNVYHNMA